VLLVLAPHDHLAYQTDPDDISAQIDMIGLPWLVIGEDPSAAPNGSARGYPGPFRWVCSSGHGRQSPVRPRGGQLAMRLTA
jgi:hypothetical protein